MRGFRWEGGIGVLDPSGRPGVQSLEEDEVCNDDSEVTTLHDSSTVSRGGPAEADWQLRSEDVNNRFGYRDGRRKYKGRYI